MPVALARGQTSSITNPELVLAVHEVGFLVDANVSVEFQIFDVSTPAKKLVPVQVFPGAGRELVNLVTERLSQGRYVATYTPIAAEPLGDHEVRWFYTVDVGDTEVEVAQAFSVLSKTEPHTVGAYTLLRDLRLEGVPDSVSDDRLLMLVELATAYVDRVTGRRFRPEFKTIKIDGRGRRTIILDEPIIAVESVTLDTSPFSPADLPLDKELFRVYNRHISQGLVQPDDRNNPKIEFFRATGDVVGQPSISFEHLIWPIGQQNVSVVGVFGYTDPDGSSQGSTPRLLRHIASLLVLRNLPKLARTSIGSGPSGPIMEERTRDQQVKFADPTKSAIQGVFTGSAEIDTLLASYVRPAMLGAA